MNGREFRANAAGWLDSATTLTRTVIETLKAGQDMRDEHGRPKVECPQAVYQELLAAESHLARVASWLLDNSFKLD
jgi:hypothetical protein